MRQERQAERDQAEEAQKRGMTLSYTSYSIPGRGSVYVATDKPLESFSGMDAYVKYIYDNRHDRDRVRFINLDKNNLYSARSEQDLIAKEVAAQEDVEVKPPFQREAEEERREQTRSFPVSYAGTPVRITMDLSGMGREERERLQADIDSIRFRPAGEAFVLFENDFSKFLDKYLASITEIRMRGRSVRIDEATMSEIGELARRA
ncbi:MAG: hypothetical protein AB1657_01485 [Candidatus Micrarchaeota archaeon]